MSKWRTVLVLALLGLFSIPAFAQFAQAPLYCEGVWCTIRTLDNYDGTGSFLTFQAPTTGGTIKDYAFLNGGRLAGDGNGDLDVLVLRGGVPSGFGLQGGASAILPSDPGWKIGADTQRFAKASLEALDVRANELRLPDGTSRLVNVTLDNQQNSGDNTALYSTANKWGSGATFAGVFEAEDTTGVGPVWGMEVDVLSRGKQGDNPWLRYGLGVVLGVNQGLSIPTTIGYGLAIIPNWRDRQFVDANFGVYVGVHCNFACIAVKAGEKIALEESGTVAVRFDPTRRVIGFWNGPTLLWGVNVDSKATVGD